MTGFPCQRCGSETWTSVSYAGCSDCLAVAERPVVYIAGPYSKPDPCENTHAAVAVANRIVDVCAPLIPHLSHFWHTMTPKPYEFWLDLDLQYLRKCDAVLRFEGESPGADTETELALAWGIPVFYDEQSLRGWIAS